MSPRSDFRPEFRAGIGTRGRLEPLPEDPTLRGASRPHAVTYHKVHGNDDSGVYSVPIFLREHSSLIFGPFCGLVYLRLWLRLIKD